MRKLRNLMILCAVAGSLSGCAWRNLGPCYGIGCPARSSTSAPQQKTASANDPNHTIAQAAKPLPEQHPAPSGQ
jgi:hypothetical protein